MVSPSAANTFEDGGHQRPLARLSCHGSVEIDDVDPARARRGEGRRCLGRVIAVDVFAAEVALAKPDDAAASKVDRREDREA